MLAAILKEPDKYKERLPEFYKKMVEGGFIVEDSVDETDIVKERFNNAVNSKHHNIIILPTLNCNFHCWYCYEKHDTYVMTNETLERVKKYIRNVVANEGAESLNIEWFGGEPMLHFYDIIKPVNEYAVAVCNEYGIPFTSGATTNGYLIDADKAGMLAHLHFYNFQITLDGDRSHHDKTREAKGESSFDRILSNINCICSKNPDVRILLRLNYDDRNLNPELLVSQICDRIESELCSRISFMARRVWQVDKVENGREKIINYIEMMKKKGFYYKPTSDFIDGFIPCYAARRCSRMITPRGSVTKCTTKNNFEEEALGHIAEDGKVKWNNDLPFDDIYAKPLFDNDRCLKCKRLPLCMGPCPRCIQKDGTCDKELPCRGNLNDLGIDDLILKYCDYYSDI